MTSDENCGRAGDWSVMPVKDGGRAGDFKVTPGNCDERCDERCEEDGGRAGDFKVMPGDCDERCEIGGWASVMPDDCFSLVVYYKKYVKN